MKQLQYLNKYLFRYKGLLFWGTIFTIISNFFMILPAQIVRYAFNLVEETIDLYFIYENFKAQTEIYNIFTFSILGYGVLILLMALLRGVFLFFVRQTIIVMSRLAEFDLKNDLYEHYQKLPLSFYRKNNTGDLMARISEDVGQVRMYLGPGIMYGINLITLMVMIIPYMLSVNVELTLYTLIPLPFLSVSIYFVNSIINRRSTEIQQSLSRLSTYVQEAFSGIRVLKAFVRQKDSVENFDKESTIYKEKSLRLVRVESLFYPLILLLIGLSNIIVIYVGGIEVAAGTVSRGNIAEFILYLNIMIWPVTALGWITSIIQRAAASQKRINEFLNEKSEITSSKNIEKAILGEISFKNVSLIYPESGIKALNNVSFDIKAGEAVAILGGTGSGKSTLANLMCRMYDVNEGEILIDNHNIKDYEVAHLRKQVGYVPQDVFLFSDTIENNINFGLPTQEISQENMIKAAKDADVYQNIMDFKEGFQTVVGERGITLSGGQKQRVSIARALVRKPQIMVLDDCLSAVDTKTENAILNSLQALMQNKTSIIISHRISSAKLADRIIVLEDGKIAQQGAHSVLIAQEGLYKDLYERQLQGEETNE